MSIEAECENWRRQALEENSALDIARESLETSKQLIRKLTGALKELALLRCSNNCVYCASKNCTTKSYRDLVEEAKEFYQYPKEEE